MKRVAILIATTGGPVLVDRITPEPAPQSMVCLRRQSEVLPISVDYDDFVRPGSGVIMREFGPYDEGAFRLDVSGPIGTGNSWQLGVFAAHAVFKSQDVELSDLETADQIVWLTGTVDYDLNVGDVGHMAEKVEASAIVLADYIAKGTPIVFGAAPDNAKFLHDHQPPKGIEVVALRSGADVLGLLGLGVKQQDKNSRSFWFMAPLALAAIGSVFVLNQKDMWVEQEKQDAKPVEVPLTVSLSSDRGRNPLFHFGDDLNLMVEISKQAWLNCFYRQVDGTVFQVYPNDQISDVRSFSPNRVHILSGGENAPFVIRLGPPAGKEDVTCFATEKNTTIDPTRPPKGAAKDTLRFELKP